MEVRDEIDDVEEEIRDRSDDLEFFGEGPIDRFKRWFLIRGDRRHVALGLLVGVYLAFCLMTLVWPDMTELLRPGNNNLATLFNTFLRGVILLVSIVTSINSLVISQELTPIGNQHEQVVESWDFRERAAEITGEDISPAVPGQFLRSIIEAVEDDLQELKSYTQRLDETGESETNEVREEVDGYLDSVREGLERTESVVSDPRYAAINVAMFGSSYDVSDHVNSIRKMRARHKSVFEDDEIAERLDQVIAGLQFFVSAREYFKTVYYKREFSFLSRDLLYTGLPAILLISYLLVTLGSGDGLPVPQGGIPVLSLFRYQALFLAFFYTVALGPFIVLTSYTIRAAIIAQKTVTEGAFILE